MSDQKTVTKKLKFHIGNSYNLHVISGASLTSLSNNRTVLNFFSERPILPNYAELEIEASSGLVIKEVPKIDEDFLDLERVFMTGIDLDFNTLKAISTLLLTHLNNIENNKSNK